MQIHKQETYNRTQIELHLKSAIDVLTPNVLDRINLSTPQEVAQVQTVIHPTKNLGWNPKARQLALTVAACLCILVMGGGMARYQIQTKRIDSVIGIDVNPSVELSINKKNRVIRAQALNTEANLLIADMNLEGVDLNVAVNAVIGSMVTHGYLDDLDNAILVTVSNDSIKKATALRTSVVGDIEKTLEENQVQAVVYDQQVIERDEMKALADTYGISYGKAYFLKELIDQNKTLTLDNMEELASLSMEEIAGRITTDSFALGDFAHRAEETTGIPDTQPETTILAPTETTTIQGTTEAFTEEITTMAPTTQPETTITTTASPPETTQEEVEKGGVEIDYVDYEDGSIYVYFVTKVRWKNPTVSIQDEHGNSYAAMIEDTSSDECVIQVSGLEGGKPYTFVLGGLTPAEGGKATTVQGYFDKPEIAGEATTASEEDTKEETTTTKPSQDPTTEPVPTSSGGEEESKVEPETIKSSS